MVSFHGAGLITTKTHGYVVQHRRSVTAHGPMDALPGKPFHVYVKNLTANLDNFPIMIVAYH